MRHLAPARVHELGQVLHDGRDLLHGIGADDFKSLWIQRKLAGEMDRVAVLDGLAIMPDGSGCLFGPDGDFLWHDHHPPVELTRSCAFVADGATESDTWGG